jgi:hypothetical protein
MIIILIIFIKQEPSSSVRVSWLRTYQIVLPAFVQFPELLLDIFQGYFHLSDPEKTLTEFKRSVVSAISWTHRFFKH